MGIEDTLNFVLFMVELVVFYLIVSFFFNMVKRFFDKGNNLCERKQEQIARQRKFYNSITTQQSENLEYDYHDTYQNEGFLYGLFFGHPILGMLFGSMFKKPKE